LAESSFAVTRNGPELVVPHEWNMLLRRVAQVRHSGKQSWAIERNVKPGRHPE